MTTILRGVVGSTAYGLAREGSDVDRLGVFVAPTVQVAGLSWNRRHETRVTHAPDSAEHEIGKYLRLALDCNPTVLELLYLPDSAFEVCDRWGLALRALRPSLLSEKSVRSSYGGYARQQAHKLAQRGDGTFSSDTKNRSVKHARHLLRLLRQGRQLLETGDLTVHVGDPTDYFAMDRMDVPAVLEVYEREDALFHAARSVLPETPDRPKVEGLLAAVRREHLG